MHHFATLFAANGTQMPLPYPYKRRDSAERAATREFKRASLDLPYLMIETQNERGHRIATTLKKNNQRNYTDISYKPLTACEQCLSMAEANSLGLRIEKGYAS